MNFKELILDRSEVPLVFDGNNVFQYFKVPIPSKIYEKEWTEKELYDSATSSINYTFDQTIPLALLYEVERMKKINQHIFNELAFSKDFDTIKCKAMIAFGLIQKEGEKPVSRWADARYLCNSVSRVFKEGLNEQVYLNRLDRLLRTFNNEPEDIKAQLKNNFVQVSNMISFNLFTNGTGCDVSKEILTYKEYNMSEERFNTLFSEVSACYCPHNVFSIYSATLLNELTINYLNSLAKNL
jgi:hypothetical protein